MTWAFLTEISSSRYLSIYLFKISHFLSPSLTSESSIQQCLNSYYKLNYYNIPLYFINSFRFSSFDNTTSWSWRQFLQLHSTLYTWNLNNHLIPYRPFLTFIVDNVITWLIPMLSNLMYILQPIYIILIWNKYQCYTPNDISITFNSPHFIILRYFL